MYKTTSKDLVEDVPLDTILFQQAGGGGGYGDPFHRDPELVAKEVKNGIISLDEAKERYGVIVDPKTFELNPEETEKLRNR
jgi:N-methylhydantoinase B